MSKLWQSFCIKLRISWNPRILEFLVKPDLLHKNYYNLDISQAILKILVSNHIYTFSPSILNQFPVIIFKNISSRSRTLQKIQNWENPVFGLYTQFKLSNHHLSLIFRTVLETLDQAEFKTVPKCEDNSKIGWVMGLQKYFFWKIKDV